MLLISSNTETVPYPVFPLGIAFLQAALNEAGHAVRVWDALVHLDAELAEGMAWATAVGLSMRNIDNVSAKSPKGYVAQTQAFIERIRAATKAPIIIGGSAFSIFPEEILDAFAMDWGIQGEGEAAFLQWLDCLQGHIAPEQIPGLVYRRNGAIVRNPTRALDIGEIAVPRPDPEWIRSYLDQAGMMNLQTQRGCGFHCTYCTYPLIEGRCYRFRRAQDIVSEIQHLYACGVRYVFFTDSVFNTDAQHVRSVCDALIEADTGMHWGCFARPEKLSDELLEKMIAAGMQHIEFGSDSFCDQTLKRYGKSFRFADILATSKRVAAHKVHACHYIIFGGPGETPATIKETVDNSRLLPDAPIFAFSGMRIYPRTPLFKQSKTPLSFFELLQPHFYEDPGFPATERNDCIRSATAGLPQWILSDHADDHAMATAALRRRGKQGPLWEYLDLIRRMNPSNLH